MDLEEAALGKETCPEGDAEGRPWSVSSSLLAGKISQQQSR